jgi:hypothetical protein
VYPPGLRFEVSMETTKSIIQPLDQRMRERVLNGQWDIVNEPLSLTL